MRVRSTLHTVYIGQRRVELLCFAFQGGVHIGLKNKFFYLCTYRLNGNVSQRKGLQKSRRGGKERYVYCSHVSGRFTYHNCGLPLLCGCHFVGKRKDGKRATACKRARRET